MFTEDMAIKGQLGGMAAVGMTGANWYCTTEEKCRYVPLLQAYDRFGRERGPAGGLMLNYAGLYKGSAWAFFGVDTMDLVSPGDAALGQGFVRLVKRLRDPLFLHETASDLYQIEAVLLDGAEEIDRESTNGFVVWQDEVLNAASRLSLRDNYLRIGDRPTFLTGTPQFWASRSYRTGSPLTIARDFRDMRDYGVRLSRSFMRWKVKESDREEQRSRDMMVYLAQRYGVVMYHEGTGAFPQCR